MERYSIKGVLWYQGCSDSDFGDRYYTYLEALKKTMRSTFGNDELPILVVQLHASYWAGCDILASQSKSASDDKNCYLVSTFNEGTPFKQADYDPDANYNAHVFTHPSRKSPVGQRAADIALKNIYGLEEYENSGEPMVQKVTVSGDTLVLTFNQELCTEYDVAPTGFEIAGSDGVFYKANAVLSGNVITLNADEVVIIDHGHITACDTPAGLKTTYTSNRLLWYTNKASEFDDLLISNGFKFEYSVDSYKIYFDSYDKIIEFIYKNKNIVNNFEVIKGDMDDVFLNVTGKELDL